MASPLAVLPSQGVSPNPPIGNDITLRVSDVSGRGTPHFAVLLPVSPAPAQDRYAPHAPLPGAMWCAALNGTQDPVIALRAPCALWQGGAEGVLVVLIYAQAPGIGGNAGGAFGHVLLGGYMPAAPGGFPVHVALPAANLLPAIDSQAMAGAVASLLAQHRIPAVRLCVVPANAVPAPQSPAQRQGRAAAPDDAGLCFALMSCQYTAGLLDARPAGASYARLAQWLERGEAPQPRFLVQTGDQVYVDATAGLFDPAVAHERFSLCYERRGAMRDWLEVQRRLPAYSLPDDHEIGDNWEDEAVSQTSQWLLDKGVDAYLTWQRLGGPMPSPQPAAHRPDRLQLWCATPIQGFEFFFADTRTEREMRRASSLQQASILSAPQWQALTDWLAAPTTGRPRFLVCPTAVLPRQLATREHPTAALRSDGWDGYPASLHRLLALLCEHRAGDVVLLSGDLHLSCVATATIWRHDDKAGAVTVRSIHSSALYAPYPFANARPDELAGCETFAFEHAGRPYHCRVRTTYPPGGDGFCLVTAGQQGGHWQVRAAFDLAGGRTEVDFTLP